MAGKKESLFDLLVQLPWWVSVVLSGISYLTLKYFIPTIEIHPTGSANINYILFKELSDAAPSAAPFISLSLLFLAPLSVLNTRSNRKKTPAAVPARKPSSIRQRSARLRRKCHGKLNIKNVGSITDSLPDDIESIEYICVPNNAMERGNYAIGSDSPADVTLGIEFKYADDYIAGDTTEPEKTNQPVDFSVKTLKKIEWYTFELLCKIYFESIGYRVEKTKAGAEGGIDLLLHRDDTGRPYAIAQCKARAHRDTGVKYARELLGVMTSEKVSRGILITNSGFTREAADFANNHAIELIDVSLLSMSLYKLGEDKRQILLDFLSSTDFTTPICPNCEVKLVERIAKSGKDIGQKFWGCKNFPKCRYKMPMHSGANTPKHH
jgi:restriction system protein